MIFLLRVYHITLSPLLITFLITLVFFFACSGTTVLAVAEDKLTKFMDKLTNAGVGFQNTLNDISQYVDIILVCGYT